MSSQLAEPVIRQCVGRFCLGVPASMARTSDTFALQYVSMKEVLWKEPDDKARELAWTARLARIEALKARRELPTDVQGEIRAQRELASGFRGVMFHEADNPALISWGGLLRRGPVDVWMQIDGDLDREDQWAARLVALSQAYRPMEPKEPWPVPGKDWFYLHHGLVALPMKFKEEAQSVFEGHPLNLKLAITTKTESRVNKKNLMQRLSDSLALASGEMQGSLVTQKYKSRKVAGLPGEELILRYTEGNDSELYCLWTYAGEENSGSHPKMTIEMESSLEQDDAKVALWNQLLDSVRPAGL
ncbi:T6SS immunity protein Tli4 family protein [Vitiosangium sp. GDMCC 1.1324]|uniref:T6SS immunity protein Tli4 family protein n=1 Tax=Vitiosangium sp. (strain GDMCC 1.1324) TaxID=2138576 RepID=UPI0011B769D6|nr:T6SS immunity protein Tli4 family protein [Vitiosangium sp. GDMCC 1.1324]